MKLKYIFLLSALLLAYLPVYAQEGRTIEYDGNIITIENLGRDSLEIIDPETNEPTIVFKRIERFAKLNGNPIYQGKEVEQPIGSSSQPGINGFIEKLLDDEIRSNKNSFYNLELILDEKGKIAYFKTRFNDNHFKPIENSSATSDMLIKLGDVKFKPATKDGVPVAYYIKIE